MLHDVFLTFQGRESVQSGRSLSVSAGSNRRGLLQESRARQVFSSGVVVKEFLEKRKRLRQIRGH